MPAVPYRGIQPFRYADHAIFFARETETRKLARLVDVYRGVFLYGDSGNGKSSLVNAGLLPQARELGFDPVRVRVQPRADAEIVIEQIAISDDHGRVLPCVLAPEADASARVVVSVAEFEQRVIAVSREHQPLIVFDQFEEILTLFEDGDALASRGAIAEMIVRLLRRQLPVKLLFAFREDHLGRVKQLLAARPELVDQALQLGPPSADALPTIIRGPFERHPGHFEHELEPALAARLEAALAQRFGSGDVSLSEVQTVCLRLWQSPDPEALLAAKGAQGLLEDALGEALDALSPDLRAAAVALLSHMVTPAGTRNVVSAADLHQRVREDDERIAPALLDQALDRLERESKLVRRERRRDIYLYEITSEFLVPWISRRREEVRRTQARRRERRRASVFLVVVAVLASIAVWALDQRATAQRQATASRSLALVAASGAQLDSRPDVALLLAAEAYRTSPRPEARSGVVAALPAARGSGVLGILHGHDGVVASVAPSPDGRMLASAGADGTIRLWSVRTHRQLGQPLTGHAGNVHSVAFSPDGRMLASTGADATVRLWDVRTHRQLRSLAGHVGTVWEVAFSGAGDVLASAGDDGTVRLWDVASGRPVATLAGHRGTVFGVAFSPDGNILASAGDDTTIRLWDVRTHRQLRELRGHSGRVVKVAFSPSGRLLASAGFDRTVRLWDLRTNREVGELTGHDRPVYGLSFRPDGRRLATAGGDGTVRLWDVGTRRQVGEPLTGHVGVVFGVAFTRDGHTLASAGADTTIRVVDVRIRPGALTGHTGSVFGVAVSPDGRMLASAGADKAIRLWDLRTHAMLGMLIGHSKTVTSVAFSPAGRMLASAGADATVRLWDVRAHRQLAELTGHEGLVRSVAFSPDGDMVASAGFDGTVRLWDVHAHREVGKLSGHDGRVSSVAFGLGGRVLASAGTDKTVRLWDVRSRRQIGKLTGHTDFVWSVAFGPDQHTLASAGYDNTIRLWDVRSRRQLGPPLTGHARAVYSVAFSPDGETLASASDDETIRLWDVRGRAHQQVGRLSGRSAVSSVAVTPAGTLASGGYDNTVRLWEGILWPGAETLQRDVCDLMGAGLGKAEWKRYGAGLPYHRACS